MATIEMAKPEVKQKKGKRLRLVFDVTEETFIGFHDMRHLKLKELTDTIKISDFAEDFILKPYLDAARAEGLIE